MTGGASSASRGSHYERELTNTLRDLGLGVLRIPSSGAVTDEDLPDILAARGVKSGITLEHKVFADAMAIELKSGKATTLYVGAKEVEALSRFASKFGATPYLGARFTTQGTPTTHFLVKPKNARMTDSGRYGLPVEDIDERASVKIHPGDVTAMEGEDV